MMAETKTEDNKNKVGNRRSQVGNKVAGWKQKSIVRSGNDPQQKFKQENI